MEKKTIELFQDISRRNLGPIPKLTVSEWADQYRFLSSEGSSEPGRWRTDRAPYQREIMDAFTQYGVHKVVVKSCSQIGKSDVMNNVIGRFAMVAPAPIMMVQPTIDMAQDYSKSRIAPMIRDSKALGEIFRDVKSRDSGNTILSKLFPGGRLIMGGANSPAGLASRPIKILLCDEVDRFPLSAGSEGDPIDLASKRMTTFWDNVMGLFSTPTNAGESRIDDEYLTGTQEEWQHECPNCGEYHLLTNRQLNADYSYYEDLKGKKHIKVNSVKWRCPDCGFEFNEIEMRHVKQKYVAQNASALEKGVRSFFVNCWSSPWLRWTDVMQEWLEAKGDPEREKVVYNTRFGESYERKGNFDGPEIFLERREDYGAELADGVMLLTAAVDVQDNRLEYEICGWGKGEECWGIRKDIILGIPDTQAVWDMLDEQLDREYARPDGVRLVVARTFIDSGGHYSNAVYNYCLRHIRKQRFAIKGANTPGVPVIHKYSKVTVGRKYTIPLIMLGVDSAKQYVMDRLSIEEKGPKYFHFPLDTKDRKHGYDEIYFKGLISEQRVPHKKNGRIVWQWEVIAKDKRNEPLDLRGYNLACLKSINPDFERLEAVISQKIGEKVPKSTQKTSRKSIFETKTPQKASENTAKKQVYGCIKKSRIGGIDG